MSTTVNASVMHPSMYTPMVRCHYTPNISANLVQFTDVILGSNGEPKLNGEFSVEIVSYTIINGNIQLQPLFTGNLIDFHA